MLLNDRWDHLFCLLEVLINQWGGHCDLWRKVHLDTRRQNGSVQEERSLASCSVDVQLLMNFHAAEIKILLGPTIVILVTIPQCETRWECCMVIQFQLQVAGVKSN